MTGLPKNFLQRMQELLGDEYPAFLDTFNRKRSYGLRVNTLKLTPEELKRKVPFHLTPIPWANEGFYYKEEDEPGKHYYHSAGLYYIQEPSAMAPVALLGVKPGEKILDLCAAPGGKTTQIGAALKGKGLVVANDINLKRAQVLAMNLERMGVTNAFVTYESPERLLEYFPAYFDRILVDAPCSGEGMFRKMPEAIDHWKPEYILNCAEIQREILDHAAKMLKPGGVMIYSTCTFAPEENEGTIQEFLKKHPEFELIELPHIEGFQPGRPEWVIDGHPDLKKTVRLWPHYLKGEGHFVALLRKMDGNEKKINPYKSQINSGEIKEFYVFCKQNLHTTPEGHFTLFGNHLYLTPPEVPSFAGLKVLRPGWYLGQLKKNRFEPAHALATGLKANDAKRTLPLYDESEIHAYLRGETLQRQGDKGWTLVTVDGFPLGWGKMVNGILKNHFPRSMRWFF
ncbi:hypothetical protein BBF96_04805 [Anoxybacter fermentans]|uniref:SAM-dependent MTase RsmB/NOP-type domain-containing protein n=1 Tax=Anoxybacter fermentans TaxID=1323375 RepID=A0A3S9SWV2_9FIRM|nr:RsmF rRNA methyltransferase first C-terminal domain-containing protein [Anoxybacter fermentans]AZR72771.1 hypothetical protein BBF96_04805 [Anoxybacter fermentans]